MANGKPDLAAIIAAGPQGGDETSLDFLGVGTGYTAIRQGPDAPQQVAPLYAEGSQYEPGGGSPEDIARLQQTLDRTGLFQKGDKYRLGVWDETSTGAYTRLLKFANQQGYDAPTALKRIGQLSPEDYDELYGKGAWARSTGTKGVGGPGAKEDVTRGTINQRLSEDDLRYLANKTARSSLGRSLSPEELNQFSGAYTQMISAATNREAAATAAAEGGANATYQGATSPEVFAEQQAQRMDPNAFEARRQIGALRSIGSMLGELGGS